ncbi:unnamed protein product [Trichogramma brassicae]|uniref:Uncharacterized protein n=1 Tax=Trichogramma brassicae TaxID=86971 RepID=A0A6H5IPG8_9HYME|nr:unnamed protein product [Trichogramma brassicae]
MTKEESVDGHQREIANVRPKGLTSILYVEYCGGIGRKQGYYMFDHKGRGAKYNLIPRPQLVPALRQALITQLTLEETFRQRKVAVPTAAEPDAAPTLRQNDAEFINFDKFPKRPRVKGSSELRRDARCKAKHRRRIQALTATNEIKSPTNERQDQYSYPFSGLPITIQAPVAIQPSPAATPGGIVSYYCEGLCYRRVSAPARQMCLLAVKSEFDEGTRPSVSEFVQVAESQNVSSHKSMLCDEVASSTLCAPAPGMRAGHIYAFLGLQLSHTRNARRIAIRTSPPQNKYETLKAVILQWMTRPIDQQLHHRTGAGRQSTFLAAATDERSHLRLVQERRQIREPSAQNSPKNNRLND